jgi:hypothetical protein
MSHAELTVLADPALWPQVKALVEQHQGKMTNPAALANPAEAPNFPVELLDPILIKKGLEFVDIMLRDGRDVVLLVVALRELLGKRGEVVDRKSGKMYELPPETPPPPPMVNKKKP